MFLSFYLLQIERLRNELAHNRDFDARTLFERIETFRNGTISAGELLIFLQDHHVKTINEEECKEIIAEFDSNLDGTMGYDEFLNCLLPATNPALRDFCLYGYKVPSRYTDRSQPLPVGISTMVTRIFEKEKELCRKRLQAKVDLFDVEKFDLQNIFHDISRGKPFITMPDLIFYLEQHAFHPRTEEIEGILRRCDHDSDGALSYEEFCCLIEDIPLDNA